MSSSSRRAGSLSETVRFALRRMHPWRVVIGEDLMIIVVGDSVEVRRP